MDCAWLCCLFLFLLCGQILVYAIMGSKYQMRPKGIPVKPPAPTQHYRLPQAYFFSFNRFPGAKIHNWLLNFLRHEASVNQRKCVSPSTQIQISSNTPKVIASAVVQASWTPCWASRSLSFNRLPAWQALPGTSSRMDYGCHAHLCIRSSVSDFSNRVETEPWNEKFAWEGPLK